MTSKWVTFSNFVRDIHNEPGKAIVAGLILYSALGILVLSGLAAV